MRTQPAINVAKQGEGFKIVNKIDRNRQFPSVNSVVNEMIGNAKSMMYTLDTDDVFVAGLGPMKSCPSCKVNYDANKICPKCNESNNDQ